jgi:hypothetical protein
MSTIERGKRIKMTFRQRGPSGRPTLIVDVSAEDDMLPHEHREDMQEIAAAVMGVPVASLEGVEIQLRRAPPEHAHPHPYPHPQGHGHGHEHEEAPAEPPKAKA